MIVSLQEMLKDAEKKKYAIASINTPNQISLRAVIAAAEKTGMPITLNHAQNEEEHIPIEIAIPLMVEYAKKSTAPIAIHVDHGLDMTHLMKAMVLGCNSLMYDCSNRPLDENIREVKRLIDLVRPLGVAVEAEVGTMPNNMPNAVHGQEKSDLSDLSVYFTKPDEAKRFCDETNVDVLTISMGTVHGVYEGEPKLNIDLLKKIRGMVSGSALGMHGGSGTPFDQIRTAICNGLRKINVFTALDTAPAPYIAKMISDAKMPTNFYAIADKAMEVIYDKTVEFLEVCKNQ
jgi:fructose-bisphosphate aldolase, class II